MKKKMTK